MSNKKAKLARKNQLRRMLGKAPVRHLRDTYITVDRFAYVKSIRASYEYEN